MIDNSLKQNPAKPATELAFPSVTICSPGLNMEAVEEAVYKDFEKWSKERGNSQKKVGDFMEEMYAMKIGKGNIFDKIKAMSLPPIRQDSALLEKLEACREQANKMSNRKKRSAAHRAQGEYHATRAGILCTREYSQLFVAWFSIQTTHELYALYTHNTWVV